MNGGLRVGRFFGFEVGEPFSPPVTRSDVSQ